MNKRQEKYKDRITGLSNRELWEEYKEVSQPDAYDGAMTNQRMEEFIACEKEVEIRLNVWLSK